MVIKKYIATTEEEAIGLAKGELGEDAVIMNVKTMVPKGISKLFKKPAVEVTAAVDESAEETKEEVPDFSKLQEAIREQEEYTAPDSKAAKQEAKWEKLIQSDQIVEDIPKQEEQVEADAETEAIEQKLNSLQDLLEKQVLQTHDKQEKESEDKEKDKSQSYFQLIREKMIDNEVHETFVDQILDSVRSGKNKEWTLDNILAGVYQKIILSFGQSHLIDVRTKKTKYIFFVGPTGVGKTTTIAKIASTLKLTKKTKVALITSDTYRIAAVDQLKTYANILGIPLEVVYSAEEMDKVMDQLKGYDLVLVDTAGRSHQNPEQIQDMKELLDKVPAENKETYLVLSATTKYKDLVKIAQTYQKITDYYLVFTKLDETDTVGNILNIRMLTGAALAYATWGQNVPDDIGKIDAQKMAKQILGGNG